MTHDAGHIPPRGDGKAMRLCGMAAVAMVLVVLFLPRPSWAGSGSQAVQSLSVDQMDALIRQPGSCVAAVMAAWCHPCIEELPALNTLARRYRPQGLRMLGLSVDYAGPQAMQPIVDRLKIAFPVYWVGEDALDTYAVTRIPLLLFFRDGRIVKRLQGGRSLSELDQEIAAFLAVP